LKSKGRRIYTLNPTAHGPTNGVHFIRDDECRVRTDNAPANFATFRHMAYNLARKAPGKDSIRLRRKTAAWDDEYLASLVAAQ
jgi:hypothetical protein